MEDLSKLEVIDFGLVEPDKVYIRIYTVSDRVTTIEQSPFTHELDKEFFTVTNEICNSGKTSSGSESIKITFKPQGAPKKFCDYFKVTLKYTGYFTLCVKGETVEANVECSVKKILFQSRRKNLSECIQPKRMEKMFKLYNRNNSSAEFFIDLVNTNSIFQITPRSGVISPYGNFNIKVSFNPIKKYILYYKEIFIMVRYMKPLKVTLCGSWKDTVEVYSSVESHNYVSKPEPELDEYLCDANCFLTKPLSSCLENKITVYITPRYKNMGNICYTSYERCTSKYFTLKNRCTIDVRACWPNDPSNPFEVKPGEAVVPSGCDRTFQVVFTPVDPDCYSCAELQPVLQWASNEEGLVPFSPSITCLGSSFGEREVWIPKYQVEPDHVLMNSTLPREKNHGQFKISRLGHLPIKFELFPSTSFTQFTVKPIQGLICDNFVIISVRFNSEQVVGRTISEHWILKVNNDIHPHPITFTTTISLPYLKINDYPLVELDGTLVHTCSQAMYQIKNPSLLPISYSVEAHNPNFSSHVCQGELYPNEQIRLPLIFHPTYVGAHHHIFSIFSSFPNSLSPIRHLVEVKGNAQEAVVQTNPDFLSFNTYLDEVTDFFIFVNYRGPKSPAKITITARDVTNDYLYGAQGKVSWTFEPKIINVTEQGHPKVNITLHSKSVGFSKIELGYQFATIPWAEWSEQTEFIPVTPLHIYCTFPQLKIIDLHTWSDWIPLSKLEAWSILNINHWNCALETLGHFKNESTDATFELPVHERNSTFKINLLVQNLSEIDIEVSFTKIKLCDCKYVDQLQRINIYKKVLICPHEHSIEIQPSRFKLKPREKKTILIATLLGKVLADYLFKLKIQYVRYAKVLSRTMNVTIKERPVKTSSCKLLIDSELPLVDGCYEFQLNPVYIGSTCPPIQGFWLFNYSDTESECTIQLDEPNCMSIQLLTKSMFLRATSKHPVLIRFAPNQFKTYYATGLIKTEYNELKFSVKGDGHSTHFINPYQLTYKTPLKCLFQTSFRPLLFTEDHLVFSDVPQNTDVERIIVLKNTSDSLLRFKWSYFCISDLLTITVAPKVGFLQPHSMMDCKVTAHTLCKPMRLSAKIYCYVLNVTKYQDLYEDKSKQHHFRTIYDNLFAMPGKNDSMSKVGEFELSEAKQDKVKPLEYDVCVLGVTVCSQDSPHVGTIRNLRHVTRVREEDPIIAAPVELTQDESKIVKDILTQIVWKELIDPENQMQISRTLEERNYSSLIRPQMEWLEDPLPVPDAPEKWSQKIMDSVLQRSLRQVFSPCFQESRVRPRIWKDDGFQEFLFNKGASIDFGASSLDLTTAQQDLGIENVLPSKLSDESV